MARSLLLREPLVGHWLNRTKEWVARRRGEDFGKYDYATRYEIELQPLPGFRDLSADDYRDVIARLVEKIQNDAQRSVVMTASISLHAGSEIALRSIRDVVSLIGRPLAS